MLKRPTNISQCSILSKKCTFDNRIFLWYWWEILYFWRILNFDAWWFFQIGAFGIDFLVAADILHILDQKNITCTTESKQMLLKFQNTCNSIFFARCYGKMNKWFRNPFHVFFSIKIILFWLSGVISCSDVE